MGHANGEYKTIYEDLLEGYKGKIYGNDELSSTMRKVVIQNGKVTFAEGELPGYNEILDLTKTDGGSNNKNLEITDSNTNIKLEAQSGVVPDNTTIDVKEIESNETLEKIKNELTKIENFKAFDITLKSNDINIQPNGKVKISIPIPKGFDTSKLVVYRLEKDGGKAEYQVKVANEYATFDAEHFSTYVLGEKQEASDEEQDKVDSNIEESTTENNDTKLPQTGEQNNVFATWLSKVIPLVTIWLGVMLFIEYEKKKITKK